MGRCAPESPIENIEYPMAGNRPENRKRRFLSVGKFGIRKAGRKETQVILRGRYCKKSVQVSGI
jgi:hypothetical protein